MQAALFAPPVFFLFIAEGFRYTRSRKKYAMRLLLFAVITRVPFCLVNFGTIFTVDALLNWNIFLTLFLGLLALIVWESGRRLPIRIDAVILIDAVTVLLGSEWEVFGAAIILGLHIFRDEPKKRLIWFTVCAFGTVFIYSAYPITARRAVIG